MFAHKGASAGWLFMNMEIPCDSRTLYLLEYLVNALGAVIMLTLHRQRFRTAGTLWWVAGFAFLASGAALGWLLREGPGLAVALARLSGYACMWLGMRSIMGKRPLSPNRLMTVAVGTLALLAVVRWSLGSVVCLGVMVTASMGVNLAVVAPLIKVRGRFACSFTKVAFTLISTALAARLAWLAADAGPSGHGTFAQQGGLVFGSTLALFGMLLVISEELQGRIVNRIGDMKAVLVQTERALASGREAVADNIDSVNVISGQCCGPLSDIAEQLAGLKGATPASEERTLARIDKMEAAARRMSEIMDIALDKDRLVDSNIVCKKAPVNMESAVREAVEEFNSSASRHCRVSVGPGLASSPRAHGDRALLKTMLLNLLDNAVKYSPADSAVTVEADARGGEAVIRVRDQGPGMPMSEQGKVFKKYYRGTNAASRAGAGVGLHLVRLIADQHGATVDFDSAPHGTTVVVRVPLS